MLIDTIKADQLKARKNRHTVTIALLTTFYSDAAMIGKNDGARATTDDEVIALAKKFIKNATEVKDNLDESDMRYINAGFEINVLSQYLPTQMSDDELKAIVYNIIMNMKSPTMKDMGIVMKTIKENHSGTYDGKIASKLVKEALK